MGAFLMDTFHIFCFNDVHVWRSSLLCSQLLKVKAGRKGRRVLAPKAVAQSPAKHVLN
jgi:hypothetical protein